MRAKLFSQFFTLALVTLLTIVSGCGEKAPAPNPSDNLAQPADTADAGEQPSTADSSSEQSAQNTSENNTQEVTGDDASTDQDALETRTGRDDPNAPLGRPAERGEPRQEAEWSPETTGEWPIAAFENYIETGDLDAIRKRGKLRILADISNSDSLHRAATLQDIEIDRAKRKAEHMGLEPVILYVEDFDDLIPALIAGKGDIIANNLTVTEERLNEIDFSIPIADAKVLLLSRKDTPDAKEGTDSLAGKTVYVTRGTIFEDIARRKLKDFPGAKLEVVDTNYAELAEKVSLGHIDFTVINEPIFDLISQYRDNLKINKIGEKPHKMAWGFRKNSPMLEEEYNKAIRHFRLTRFDDRFIGDLDKIKERGVIRAITRNHPGMYYMWKGRILGYEFELLEKFAKRLDVRLEIIVAPTHESLQQYLIDGKADIAAALLSKTERREDKGLAFGPTYMEEEVSIVGRVDDKIDSIDDLSGRTIHVLKSSSQYDVLVDVLKNVDNVNVEFAPEELTHLEILDKVADGEYDLTIADDVTVRIEHAWRQDVDNLIDLRVEDNVYAWMMRDTNPQLLKAVEEFFGDKKVQEFKSVLFNKYFKDPAKKRDEIEDLTVRGSISPYDDFVKKYSDKYDFDWRLIVAQMFQESTFNPKAKSWVGARGLMQVMPGTGKQVGEKNLFDPETSVRAGMKYLEWLHRKFEDKGISPENMMWFTLASYNAGLGHVYDAQDLAEQKGWDRNVWFDNVDRAMLLLAEKKYYEKARYGYARGREPYDYVRKIAARFRAYVALLEAHEKNQQEAEAETSRISCNLLPAWVTVELRECAAQRRAHVAAASIIRY